MILIKIEGEALEALKKEVILANANANHRIRIAVEGDQLKIKRDELMWSPGLGEVSLGDAAG